MVNKCFDINKESILLAVLDTTLKQTIQEKVLKYEQEVD